MDYWYSLDVHHHTSWDAFLASDKGPKRLWLFSTHAKNRHWDVTFKNGDGLLFGNEGHGCPEWLHETIGDEQGLTIPHYNTKLRSLNLATAAGIAVYEALRQLDS